MMQIQQLIKTLNNTEAGRTKTNDSYLRMSKDVEIGGFFEKKDKSFYDLIKKKDGNKIKIRVENCHDGIRIYNMGNITNSKADDLWAGDKIIIEKRIENFKVVYFIDSRKQNESVFFQQLKKGFELLTPHKFNLINSADNIEINVICKTRKRFDSDEIECYEIKYNGSTIKPELSNTELLEITIHDGKAILSKTKSWEFYEYKFEE